MVEETETDRMDEDTAAGFRKIIDALEEGKVVLVDAGTARYHGVPKIQDVPDARHEGFGMFSVSDGDREFTFDGGGSMRRSGGVSWTVVQGDTDLFYEKVPEYDGDEMKETLQAVVDEE